jgi:hypothetical protein
VTASDQTHKEGGNPGGWEAGVDARATALKESLEKCSLDSSWLSWRLKNAIITASTPFFSSSVDEEITGKLTRCCSAHTKLLNEIHIGSRVLALPSFSIERLCGSALKPPHPNGCLSLRACSCESKSAMNLSFIATEEATGFPAPQKCFLRPQEYTFPQTSEDRTILLSITD